ncbi:MULTISPECIES: NADP-specific glutamate dehydrogenase [unclassified Lentimicrobium]|uniref:NADP-specific glutamate dehydrogenase n=1 Tax=unclassified Lentimicrobium TaxID=2677434 RepID=UPI001554C4F5|nr:MULTISPECIES: NADP-specific glutamate dehydrogenase [unclassified Lentimicrobium]NPD46531.1 NADP-specific glutamate dehydrogenase [Lentimicrobium sp. S6]NPD85180.1 NADP-specific glutamate dehydrogenase [Lentimicrobium sp. L6]
MKYQQKIDAFIFELIKRNPNESVFHQAVYEVAENIIPFIAENKKYQNHLIFERLTDPERVLIFKIIWEDDKGVVQVNRGYRVEMNSSLGPYKGGIRFHSSVGLDSLKFLAFEQVLKNSISTLNFGGSKAGSDFSPFGKSDKEIMRFCYAFMSEIFRYLGSDTDICTDDIGIGTREVGYLIGQYKKLRKQFNGILIGHGQDWSQKTIKPEATGFGLVYFAQEMLLNKGLNIKGKRVAISGFGNIAWGAAKKANDLGAKVISISGPDGFVYMPNGITDDKLDFILQLYKYDSVEPFAEKYNFDFYPNEKPWSIKADIALPCSIQNELLTEDADMLIENEYLLLAEGTNMPCTKEAIKTIHHSGILYAPSKASSAGSMIVSGIESTCNAISDSLTESEIDLKLQEIIKLIHKNCLKYGELETGKINYQKGANIAAFVKIADAMLDQGLV